MFLKTNTEFRGRGGTVGQEIYEISVLVPFIMPGIVRKFESVDF